MKVDRVFIGEYCKTVAGMACTAGVIWSALEFASWWGIQGLACLIALCVFVLAGYAANASAKAKRFRRRIEP